MKESAYTRINYALIMIALVFSTLIIVGKLEVDKIELKRSIENYHNLELERQIKEVTEKKNLLVLIALERGKKRPNTHYLDSLEIEYGLR